MLKRCGGLGDVCEVGCEEESVVGVAAVGQDRGLVG